MSTKSPKTIGVFVDWLEDNYQTQILNSIFEAAQKKGLNVLVYEGGNLKPDRSINQNRNFIYQLISPEILEGIIIFSASLSYAMDSENYLKFLKVFQTIPLIHLNKQIPGQTSILLDNRPGFTALMNHLIHDHGYKNFAFIGGPSLNFDAHERLRIFKSSLDENHLVYNPDYYYYSGKFITSDGLSAVEQFSLIGLDWIDAIVCANDYMASGAIEALIRMGIHVPGDIAVTGFDNAPFGDLLMSPLTTVSQSLGLQGELAVDLLIKKMEGLKLEHEYLVGADLVIRDSCGCFSASSLEAGSNVDFFQPSPGLVLDQREKIQQWIKNEVLAKKLIIGDFFNEPLWAQFFQAFFINLDQSDGLIFLKTLSKLSFYFWQHHESQLCLQEFITIFRKAVMSVMDSPESVRRAEALFHQARLWLSERIKGFYSQDFSVKMNQDIWSGQLRELLMAVASHEELKERLVHFLPEIGMKSFFVATFVNEDDERDYSSQLYLAYKNDHVLDVSRFSNYDGASLIPKELFSANAPYVYFVEAISYPKRIGFALFEKTNAELNFYSVLQRLISLVFKITLLFQKVEDQTSSLEAQKKSLSENLSNLRRVMSGFIQTMTLTVEMRDPYTAGHQRRVSDLARAIAYKMGLDKEKIEGIRVAGLVHDLGKIYVPAEILNKPGKLKDLEFNLIKIHPQVAYDILKPIDFPWPIADIVLQHHEKLNGQGYPQGLKGDEICIEARVLSVADVVEAMASHRPYRESLGIDFALEEIEKNKGIVFDEKAVDICLDLFRNKEFEFKY
ncbi:MAG: substrate-binding domain-containing protein [Spirochaetales bacterium]|nr:substrate-binding domain-containing protein [Spirochaetales bacterium]